LRPLGRRLVLLRVGFGVVWAIDAYFKWQAAFVNTFMQYLAKGAQQQPGWLLPWFRFWKNLIGTDPHLFAYSAAVIETLLAICLIVGVGRRLVYVLGALWSLGIWSVPEGFGPVLVPGATDIGAAIMYALIFLVLYSLESAFDPKGWTLDSAITHRIGWWRRVAEPGDKTAIPAPANYTPSPSQVTENQAKTRAA
jgi:nitrite reductase (NO-forming)